MADRFAMTQSTVRRLRLPAIVAIAAIAALTAMTADVRARESAPSAEATAPRDAGEPIMAIVSIKSQQVTFYDADGWILKAPVSTGTTGRETPAGVFAVIEKDLDHHSTLYDDASMPHMQRITWNGIALHGGPLPGYAASHGCVRMPYGFAEKLFDKTRIGMRVIISPNDATPVEFSHAALLVPNAEAVAAAPERAETLAREADEAAKTADETKKSASEGSARGGICKGVAAQAGRAQVLSRRQSRLRRKGRRLPQRRTRPRRVPRNRSSRPLPRPPKRARNSTPPKPMRRRRLMPQPKQRMPPRRPRPGRPTRPKRRTMQSSRLSRYRSTSAARHRSSTCGGTRISRGRTEARSSMRALRFRS